MTSSLGLVRRNDVSRCDPLVLRYVFEHIHTSGTKHAPIWARTRSRREHRSNGPHVKSLRTWQRSLRWRTAVVPAG